MIKDALELKKFPDLKTLIAAAFPSYKKHKAFVRPFYGGININSYWSGGSRDEYAVVEISTLRRKSLPTTTHPFFDIVNQGMASMSNAHVSADHVGNVTLNFLPPGYVLVAAGTFCGKPTTATVYFNPADMPKLLEA